jgi:deazaflavin-dependent oxidoreductase (nitroreductase family)
MAQRAARGYGRRRPGLLLRWFYRAPVLLYHVGLGWLMPAQLLLTTVGRRSGRPHQAVVDVVGHDAATDSYYVISAYGGHSDWYRNLKANPAVRVQIRRRRFPARAEILPKDQSEEMGLDFWRRHPLYVGTMLRVIGLKAATEEEAREAVSQMNVVAIHRTAD